MGQFYSDVYQTPIGEVYIVSKDDSLCFLSFHDNPQRIERLLQRRFKCSQFASKKNTLKMRDRLDRYFNGDWRCFDELELDTGGTEFQQKTWERLKQIPVGKTNSYQYLANQVGNPKGTRAVANANASNPIVIIIPCHRVIGKNGDLTGYADGLQRKEWLLNHESCLAA